jgi:murein DD-endopeptidase MepM/ murein hydrolase activator NlpD
VTASVIGTASAAFAAGALAMAAVTWTADGARRPCVAASHPAESSNSRQVSSKPPAAPAMTPPAADVVDDLRHRQLLVPVQGVKREDLRDSFTAIRGSNRRHNAIDILAPRNTPVLAVEDGTIAKLFNSQAGGVTVYQFDPTSTYVYYYAHLERYSDGLKEGAHVHRQQVLGYVGTSGNAPKDTPHLHFEIATLPASKHWWQGTPINPYLILK